MAVTYNADSWIARSNTAACDHLTWLARYTVNMTESHAELALLQLMLTAQMRAS